MFFINPENTLAGFVGGAAIGRTVSFAPASTTFPSGGAMSFVSPANQTIAGNGETITHSHCGVHVVTTAAARTGIILQAGNAANQIITIVHIGAAANTLTFNTTDATSLVYLASATIALAGGRSHTFIWNVGLGLWVMEA